MAGKFKPIAISPIGGGDGDDQAGNDGNVIDIGSGPAIDPAATGSAPDTGRKRGRPAGTGGKSRTAAPARKAEKTSSLPIDVGTVQMFVAMGGAFIAARAKAPEIALDDEEAKQIAAALVNVGKHYNVPVSPIQQAWMGLAFTVGSIYFGKVALLRMARAANPPSVANTPSAAAPDQVHYQ